MSRKELTHEEIAGRSSATEKSRSLESTLPTPEALLAAFNGAPKILTYLLIPEDGCISGEELREKFFYLVRGTPMADVDMNTPLRYCDQTLCPQGLVKRRYEIYGHHIQRFLGYQKNPAVRAECLAAASLILDYELYRQQSLAEVFGKTASPSAERRAPLVRMQILSLLADQQQPCRLIDVEDALHFPDGHLTDDLAHLHDLGLLSYKPISRQDDANVTYQLTEKFSVQPPPQRNADSLVSLIIASTVELHNAQQPITSATIRAMLQTKKDLSSWKSDTAFKTYVLKILSRCVKQGYLRRDNFKGGEKYSDIEVTAKGKQLVDELLSPLQKICAGDQALINEISATLLPTVLKNLRYHALKNIELYYPHSMSFALKQTEHRYDEILDALFDLDQQDQSITAKNLAAELKLKKSSLLNFLKQMQATGFFCFEKQIDRGQRFYRLRRLASFFEAAPLNERIRARLNGYCSQLDPKQIHFEQKKALIVFWLWTNFPDFSELAKKVGLPKSEVLSMVEMVEHNKKLIGYYNEIFAEE